MGIVIGIFVGIIVLAWAVNSLGRSGQKMKGRSVCTFCGKRLKKSGAGYVTTCSHCGRDQPWA